MLPPPALAAAAAAAADHADLHKRVTEAKAAALPVKQLRGLLAEVNEKVKDKVAKSKLRQELLALIDNATAPLAGRQQA